MNRQLLEIRQRRGELLAKIAVQREQVSVTGRRWQMPLALADRGLAGVRFLRAHPLLVTGVIALLVTRRRGVTGTVATGWKLWRLYRSAIAFSAKLMPSRH